MSDPLPVLETLYTAVVADVLDGLGHRHQTLGAGLRAATSTRSVCGRVYTAKAEAVDAIPAEPYKLELAAIDTLESGDVLVVDAGNTANARFGGNCSPPPAWPRACAER